MAWVDETERKRLAMGDEAIFYASPLSQPITVRVSGIDADATRELPDGMLSAPFGGPILVREQKGAWIPERAIYKVKFLPEEGQALPTAQILRGDLSIKADWASIGGRYLRSAIATLVREISP